MWKDHERPDLRFYEPLPNRQKYLCPSSCGCNKLYAWKIEDDPKGGKIYHTYCHGKARKVHYVKPEGEIIQITEKNKPLRILYKLVIGLIYTDIENLPRHEIARTAEAYGKKVDEAIDGDRFVQNCIDAGILKLEKEVNGVQWFRHNLARTIF